MEVMFETTEGSVVVVVVVVVSSVGVKIVSATHGLSFTGFSSSILSLLPFPATVVVVVVVVAGVIFTDVSSSVFLLLLLSCCSFGKGLDG